MTYPPYCDICVISFSSQLESKAIMASDWFVQAMKKYIKDNDIKIPLRALGPVPCTLERINNKYRYRLILKSKNTSHFRAMIRDLLLEFYRNKDFGLVRISADINGDIGL